MRVAIYTVFSCSLFILAAGQGLAEPRIASDHFDDWFYRCAEPENGSGPARCEAVQIAQTKQGEQTVNLLTLSLSETSQDKKKQTVLTVLTPLNVFLPIGLNLTIDKGKSVTLQYRNCNNAGCWLQHAVDDKTLAALKSGQAGFAKIRLINGQNLNIKFSLKGLEPALKALHEGKKPSGKG